MSGTAHDPSRADVTDRDVRLERSAPAQQDVVTELVPQSARTLRYAELGRGAVRLYCLLVLAAALAAAVVAALARSAPGPLRPGVLLVLVVVALACLCVSGLSVHRSGPSVVASTWDLHSAWLLPAAVLLPVRVSLLLTVVLLAHAVLVRRSGALRTGAYWGGAVLGLLAARAVAGWSEPHLDATHVIGAALALLVVQGGSVVALNRMVQLPRSWSHALGGPDGLLAEATCLGLGGLLAVTLPQGLLLAVLVVPAIVLVQNSSKVPLLRRTAELDANTGLQTKLHWHNQAADRLAQAAQRDRPASVVLLDVDRFKAVNDSVGHVAGDAVLAAIAQAAANQLRGGDTIGRFGGDEIVALLVDATPDQARVVGERMSAAVRALTVQTRAVNGDPLQIDDLTVSVGVSGSATSGHQLDELLLAADGALLQAKRAGRDRVCLG